MCPRRHTKQLTRTVMCLRRHTNQLKFLCPQRQTNQLKKTAVRLRRQTNQLKLVCLQRHSNQLTNDEDSDHDESIHDYGSRSGGLRSTKRQRQELGSSSNSMAYTFMEKKRLRFWIDHSSRSSSSHDAIDVYRGLMELRK
uniref:Uncharacterized protein n=1 Tax=Populus trichocarpa TaxID=3694 RepID=A0A3N7FVE6_POPTR